MGKRKKADRSKSVCSSCGDFVEERCGSQEKLIMVAVIDHADFPETGSKFSKLCYCSKWRKS